MDGSASSSSAAAETDDARGREAPSKAKRGNAEVKYQHGQPVYFPEELVDNWVSFSLHGLYYCYNISLQGSFNIAADPTDIILAVKCGMGPDFLRHSFKSGDIGVTIKYLHKIHLNQEQVIFARRFQTTVLSLLINSDHSEVRDAIKYFHELQVDVGVVYLLLPTIYGKIDWCGIKFSTSSVYDDMTDKIPRHCHSCKDADILQTLDDRCCKCILQNSVVYAPCDRKFYNVTDLDINVNKPLDLNNMSAVSGKSKLLLVANGLFTVQNFLYKCYEKRKEPRSVKLPPELCRVVMAPVSTNTLFSFSFVPSIMCRIQCLLLSAKLKIQLGPRIQQFNIPAMKILEALTTEECQENFSMESLETLGDSFLKYVTGQNLFSKYKHREDILTSMREEKVTNTALYQLACKSELVGYIRGEQFDPKIWTIPGLGYDTRGNNKVFIPTTNNMYSLKEVSIKSKRIADTVEALTGAYLSACGEQAAVHFIKALGMDVELHSKIQVERTITTKSEELIDLKSLQKMLNNYVFCDSSLLVEALTHSSYNIAGIAACNERLEFLGDAVLDYILTDYFYREYPNRTPALLTNLRKASVNNCCYAHAAVKAGLHKHILHSSSKQMIKDLENSGRSFSGPSHGWEPGIGLPEDFADLFEAIAGAVYVDSGNDKKVVWGAMRSLLEPLATDKTMEPDPVSELKELCERKKYPKPSYSRTRDDVAGVTRVVAKVEAAGTQYSGTGEGRNHDVAKVLAAKDVLKTLKAAARG